MSAKRVFNKYLLAALVGTLAILLAIPFVRMGLVDLGIWHATRSLDKGAPGPGLAELLRLEAWSAYDANYQQALRATKVRCYARLGDLAAAFNVARAMEAGPLPPDGRGLNIQEQILRVPYEGLYKVLEKWPRHEEMAGIRGYDILREELENGDYPEALAAFLDLMPHTGSTPELSDTAAARMEDALAALSESRIETVKLASAPSDVAPTQSPQQTQHGPTTDRWAVTRSPSTRIYSETGRFLRRADAGMLLEIRGESNSQDIGRLFQCVSYPDGSTPIVVSAKDVAYYSGDLARMDPSVVELLVRRAQIGAEMENRKHALAEETRNRNPYYAEYEKARTAYRTFATEVKRLTKERDRATGAKRVDAAMTLNNMMNEGTTLDRKYRTIKNKYDGWNATHAESVETTRDPDMIRLRRELEAIEVKLQGVSPMNG